MFLRYRIEFRRKKMPALLFKIAQKTPLSSSRLCSAGSGFQPICDVYDDFQVDSFTILF